MTIIRTIPMMALLGAGVLVAGCGVTTTSMTPVATEPDVVSVRLAQAAEKASKALDTLSGIEQYREPQLPAPDDFSSAPPALTQLISIQWSGPIDQILQTLASRASMSYKVVGSPSGVPLLVNLDVYQKPLIEALHDLGLQAGRRADVSVNSNNNSIEIRYAPVDRI
ncbi:MAG: DotD/TraH family lipoprotein [Bdellovibrionales bacterium]